MTESGQPPPGGYPPHQGYPPQPGYPPQQGYPPQAGYPQQPGYPPYGGGPGYGYGYGYGPPVISSIPKVMGILMLVFGGIGVLGALVGIATGGGSFGMPQQNIPSDALLKIQQFQRIGNLVGLPMAILECFAGWWAYRYKSSAQLLSNLYAAVAMIWVVISIVLMYSWLLPTMERMMPGARGQEAKTIVGIALFVGAVFGMIWPTLILILMNRKAAKEACVN